MKRRYAKGEGGNEERCRGARWVGEDKELGEGREEGAEGKSMGGRGVVGVSDPAPVVDEGRTDRHTRVCRHCRRATRVSEARVKKATLEKRRERSVRTSGERERERWAPGGRTFFFEKPKSLAMALNMAGTRRGRNAALSKRRCCGTWDEFENVFSNSKSHSIETLRALLFVRTW